MCKQKHLTSHHEKVSQRRPETPVIKKSPKTHLYLESMFVAICFVSLLVVLHSYTILDTTVFMLQQVYCALLCIRLTRYEAIRMLLFLKRI